jgi:NADP-dependent 3-hydroxy acid dehydrogenase YdfG
MTKTALITGATSGMGLATAQLLRINIELLFVEARRSIISHRKELTAHTEVHSLHFDVRDKKAVLMLNSLPSTFQN